MATKKSSPKIDTELSRCINQLLLKEPFFAHILAGTVRKITDEVPTAATVSSLNLILIIMIYILD